LVRISYSLYLVNFPIVSYSFWMWVEITILGLFSVFLPSFVVVALNYKFVLAALNYKFVEAHYAKWLK